jgi:hypothetical protein
MCGWSSDHAFFTDQHGRVFGPEHDETEPLLRYVAAENRQPVAQVVLSQAGSEPHTDPIRSDLER